MKQIKVFFILLILIVITGCSEDSIISDNEYRQLVERTFEERKQLAFNRHNELFSVFEKELSSQQTDAMKFLFAFMPLSDLADYHGEFFLANANVSLKARKETSWGKTIPDDIFLHYVLPVRVNNENLDSFRIVYYDEIMSRVDNLSLKDAALEINHWCHEKVNYQGSDIRTSSPMATILSARGRCGEESTFTVAALRTAGIPARQVYTPRWAHNDDNHAWVEVWINGEWFYFGACEPEPVIDRGWFTEPARRAMLIHTKSFGSPYGNENRINSYRFYSEINNLAKYAVTKKITVYVTDKNGNPSQHANVEYKLYNYAEFYPLTQVPTDESGYSNLETGLGDLLIWVSKDGLFDFRKISVGESDTIHLIIGRDVADGEHVDLDLSVPIVRKPFEGLPEELVKNNEQQLTEENLIRKEYIDSWIQPEEVKSYGLTRKIDTSKLIPIFSRAMGNHNEIMSFISIVPDSLIDKALLLLEILTDKDLRDIKSIVLSDHLFYCGMSAKKMNEEPFKSNVQYTFNPRISNEMIGPWRSYFRSSLPEQLISDAPGDPSLIAAYINENIRVADDENYYNTPLTPIGVHELKVSDSWSRSIYFVAMCRSLGIPSRLEDGRQIPQYLKDNKWHDVYFAGQIPPSEKKGFVRIRTSENRPVPEYYKHFTLARFENGRYITLAYDFNRKATEFSENISIPPGKYLLVTGNRISDDRILSDLTFFELKEYEHKELKISLRHEAAEKKILGKIDLQKISSLFESNNKLTDGIKNQGLVIIWFEPDNEPTKHIFNDLPLLKSELDAWGGFFVFLNGKYSISAGFNPSSLNGLPLNSLFANDTNLEILGTSITNDIVQTDNLPVVIICDNMGNIVYISAGYRIGIGEQILKQVSY
jgi:transglutaminase-like putative cysteine protease